MKIKEIPINGGEPVVITFSEKQKEESCLGTWYFWVDKKNRFEYKVIPKSNNGVMQ